jgi:molybdopterin-guanine dinucleotide biosynthesis protein A
MPFLNPDLLGFLMDAAAGFDVVMPRLGILIHPLHAVYSRACLPAFRQELEEGRLQIRTILPRVRVRYVDEAQIDRLDPDHLSFLNINTPDDLEEARRIAGTLVDTE